MSNDLVSGNINDKINWYIRAHAHSSIGGLNLIWTYFDMNNKKVMSEKITALIKKFETFSSSKDLQSELKLLKDSSYNLANEINSLELLTKEKEEFNSIMEGVSKNIERIENIMKNPGYKEDFKLSSLVFSAVTDILHVYPDTLYGDLIAKSDKNAGKKIKLEFCEPKNEPLVYVCGYELKLLFYNLLSNAIDSIKSSGNIRVCLTFSNDSFNVELCDDGEEISAENIEKIKRHEIFTTKGTKHGHGMKIIYDIVSKYGGRIDIESKNKNTCFDISFPKN